MIATFIVRQLIVCLLACVCIVSVAVNIIASAAHELISHSSTENKKISKLATHTHSHTDMHGKKACRLLRIHNVLRVRLAISCVFIAFCFHLLLNLVAFFGFAALFMIAYNTFCYFNHLCLVVMACEIHCLIHVWHTHKVTGTFLLATTLAFLSNLLRPRNIIFRAYTQTNGNFFRQILTYAAAFIVSDVVHILMFVLVQSDYIRFILRARNFESVDTKFSLLTIEADSVKWTCKIHTRKRPVQDRMDSSRWWAVSQPTSMRPYQRQVVHSLSGHKDYSVDAGRPNSMQEWTDNKKIKTIKLQIVYSMESIIKRLQHTNSAETNNHFPGNTFPARVIGHRVCPCHTWPVWWYGTLYGLRLNAMKSICAQKTRLYAGRACHPSVSMFGARRIYREATTIWIFV